MTTATEAIPGYCVDDQCECHTTDLGRVNAAYMAQRRKEPDWIGGNVPSGLPEYCCVRCGRRGPKPLTIVPPSGHVTIQQMAQRVIDTRDTHGQLLQDYHKVWYESGHTWVYTHFLGIGLMKCPNDLWIYQTLITEHQPVTIVETGTYSGGSALWFAFLMDMLGIEKGRIFTVDLDDHRACQHQRITFLGGDSTNPELAASIRAEVELANGPLLVSLDADHSAAHVYKELCLYAPMCKVGDWLVVEDTNIGWVGEGGDQGARGGVERYLLEHQGEFVQDPLCERYLLTMNPGGWLRRVAECAHGS